MASLKMKGDLAELKVATDLLERGYKIAIPYGEDWDFDLIFSSDTMRSRARPGEARAARTGHSSGSSARSHSLTKGQGEDESKLYTAAMIDWLAVYDSTTDTCYYIPARELGSGRGQLVLRLTPAPKQPARRDSVCQSDYLAS